MAKKPDDRDKIEIALGRKMHQIGREQEVLTASQKRLKKLNDEANELDERLKKLDG